MAEGSEKRFHAVMDKLFQTPKPKNPTSSSGMQSSRGQKRGNSIFAASVAESNSREDLLEGLKRSAGPVVSSKAPLCRPWDRGDLIRRLATFKSMTWFGKPKEMKPTCKNARAGEEVAADVDPLAKVSRIGYLVVSAVNCARRGWINIDIDIIACEACGARLLFSTPPSWSQQQVEKAAAVFSLKLDNGHKLICPWIDNACDETLAHFPPMPVPALIEGYRERSSALLWLSALPVISSSAIDYMKNPSLDRFLERSSMLESGIRSADMSSPANICNECEEPSANSYYQAQKLISLCGWEPRLLPYVVDCEERSIKSSKDVHISESSRGVENGHSPTISVHPSVADEEMEMDDPSSIVLDCKLCGASVGLWAFATVRRPLELFKLVGYSEVNGQNDSSKSGENVVSCSAGTPRTYDLGKENQANNIGGVKDTGCSDASKERSLSLKLTIAGGPPPAKQNFKAKVSLPVISRHLWAGISSNSDFRRHFLPDISGMDQETFGLHNKDSFQQEQDHIGATRTGQIVQPGDMGSSECRTNEGINGVSLEGTIIQEVQVRESNNKKQSSCPSPEVNKMVDRLGNESKCDTSQNRTLNLCQNEALPEDAENAETINPATEVAIASQVRDSFITTSDANGMIGNEDISKDSSLTMVAANGCNQQRDEDFAATDMMHNKVTSQTTFKESSCRESCLEANVDIDNTYKTDSRIDKGSDAQNFLGQQLNNQDVREVGDIVHSSVNSEVVEAHASGKDRKQVQLDRVMGFDPIMQHRHFCPWIVSTGGAAPGWKLTLSALDRQKEPSHPSVTDPSPSSSTFEVDDPIASVRSLFMSPSAKRMKLTCLSS